MFKNFVLSFKIKNCYTVNQFIYCLSKIPFIGKLIPDSLYGIKELKVFSIILAIIREFVKVFGYKILYIGCFIFLPLYLYNTYSIELIIHIYIFLALIGTFTNTEMFNPTKDKYYMINLMKMDARSYTLANFMYFLGSIFVGQLVAFLLLTDISFTMALLLVSFTVLVKIIAIFFYLYRNKKTKEVINENKPSSWTLYFSLILLGLFLAYGLSYFDIIISKTIFYILFIVIFLMAIGASKSIFKFPNYQVIYKKLLSRDNVFLTENKTNNLLVTSRKQISLDPNITSDKNGFGYFHDLFVKRHKKILMHRAKYTTIIIIVVVLIFGVLMVIEPSLKKGVNSFALNYLPYMLFLMYFINTGKSVTNAMFMNCDHSMLFYRFYRKPSVLLGLFRERLKTVILINLIPTTMISISLCLLLFISGGTDNFMNYIAIFFSIIAMSIFFSVHNLVMYYLLQPYNVELEMKSVTYTIIGLITYWGCFYLTKLEVSSLVFGFIIIGFAICYSVLSLLLIYKYAPKTFKLK